MILREDDVDFDDDDDYDYDYFLFRLLPSFPTPLRLPNQPQVVGPAPAEAITIPEDTRTWL